MSTKDKEEIEFNLKYISKQINQKFINFHQFKD